MSLRISGKNLDVGEALRGQAEERVAAAVSKYYEGGYQGHVTVDKDGSAFRTDGVLHLSSGITLEASATAHDPYASLDKMAERIEKRLRRYKRRLKDRHEQIAHAAREEDAAYTIFAIADEEEEVLAEAPPVIAETRVDIPETTVSDAVMLLDLRNTNALFFKNAGTGRHNMVYRRNDGSIGWVEPA